MALVTVTTYCPLAGIRLIPFRLRNTSLNRAGCIAMETVAKYCPLSGIKVNTASGKIEMNGMKIKNRLQGF